MANAVKENVVPFVKEIFKRCLAKPIQKGIITGEQANRYFVTLFEQGDLVKLIQECMSVEREMEFSAVKVSLDSNFLVEHIDNEFVTINLHSMYDDFCLYVFEEYEPRDCATHHTLIFVPHAI